MPALASEATLKVESGPTPNAERRTSEDGGTTKLTALPAGKNELFLTVKVSMLQLETVRHLSIEFKPRIQFATSSDVENMHVSNSKLEPQLIGSLEFLPRNGNFQVTSSPPVMSIMGLNETSILTFEPDMAGENEMDGVEPNEPTAWTDTGALTDPSAASTAIIKVL